MRYQKLALALFTVFVSISVNHNSFAFNGIRALSAGPISLAMGGAGVGMPQTSNAVYINPAGMAVFGNQIDASIYLGLLDYKIGTSLAPVGNSAVVNLDNADDPFFLGFFSGILKPFNSERFRVGFSVTTVSGFRSEFEFSRVSSEITQNTYDQFATYTNAKLIPAFSFKINDELSIGAGLDIGISTGRTDTALSAPGFPQTQGRNRKDVAFGIGGRLGLIYAPIDWFQLGATYSFRTHFQDFDKYQDLGAEGLDTPREVAFGLAFKPLEGLLILTDFRWVNWNDMPFFGDSLSEGGLGWSDQYIFAGGIAYDFKPKFNTPVTMRMGYNYGRSPLRPENAFSNILVGATQEHALTTGFGFKFSDTLGLDFAYNYHFRNKVTDDGSGNPLGQGAFVENAIHGFTLGLQGSWGNH